MAKGDGKTHLTLVGAWQGTGVAAAQGAARAYEVTQADRLLLAVRQELANQFEVFGELGRGDRGRIVYLARELTSTQLVALLLVPDESAPNAGAMDFEVQIVRRLDASIPAAESECPRCRKALRGWGRFCRHCGANLSGIPERDDPASREQLLQAVRAATRGRYDVLGEMSNAEGDGVVFFARDAKSAGGGLVALRVLRETASDGVDEYSVGVTQLFGRMAESIMSPPTPIPDAPPIEAEIRPAPPTTPQVYDPPAAVAPVPVEPTPKLDERKRIAILAGGATLAAVLLIVFVSSINRKQTSDGAVTRPDSVDVQLGGAMPPGAQVMIDSQPLRGLARVLPGPHVLQGSAPGYASITQQIDLRPGQSMLWVPAWTKQTPPPETKTRVTPVTRPAAPRPQPSQVNTVSCASLFARLDWSRALKPCEDEATRGTTASQRALATMYERGLGVDVDLARALDWYRKAADGGDAFAQYRLGAMYMTGSGVKKDERVGLDWYHRAADQGQTDALLALANATERGQGVRRDKNEAFRLYLRAAELGDMRAEVKVASSYASGDGTNRDEVQAAEWFRKAAEKGDPEAQFRLGEMYARGSGVSKSDSLARVWYAKAAAKGHARAQAALR